MYTLDPLEGFKPKSFGGHRDAVLGVWFSADEKTVCLLSGVADDRYTQSPGMELYSLGTPKKESRTMIPNKRSM